ncbi:MAG: SMC-Scp complex subunit ScpB [Chloroflexota bacterium]
MSAPEEALRPAPGETDGGDAGAVHVPSGTDAAAPADGAGTLVVGVAELEALLFVAERPLTRAEIGRICGLDADATDGLLGDLEVVLRERGIRLVTSGDLVELATAPTAGPLIARYIGGSGPRLGPAALETLAIVAWRQPVTRGVIERIRGVDAEHALRGLLHRRLIVEQGRAETPGRPILYGTTMEFMERFGLTSLDDLPVLDAEIAARLAAGEIEEADAPDAPAGLWAAEATDARPAVLADDAGV